jgi:hypothetical protein
LALRRRRLVLAAGLALGVAPAAPAYDLFHPRPESELRELSSDRPGQGEGPFTVDAGHVQLETGLFDFTRDDDGGERREQWALGSTNLRVGLLDRLDVHLLFEPLVHSRVERSDAGSTRGTGAGELVTRAKWNLWGADGGRTALALLPFVQWPLAASDTREGIWRGGLIVPFAVELGGGWSAGAQTQVEWVEDREGGADTELVNALSVERELGERLASYVELSARVGVQDPGDWQGVVDGGFTYALGPNLQLDLGCVVGVSESAPDVHPFLGLTVRR